jgi:hypothetical protein
MTLLADKNRLTKEIFTEIDLFRVINIKYVLQKSARRCKLSLRIINEKIRFSHCPLEALLNYPYKIRVHRKRRTSSITRCKLIIGTLIEDR